MKVISVIDHGTGRERECDTFECVCGRLEDGSYDYFLYGWYFDAYFRRDRCCVGYFHDLDTAMDRLDELNAQLEAAVTVAGSVAEGVTV